MKSWFIARLGERTSMDGAALIFAGVVFLIAEPIASVVAYGAIGYGVYTFWKRE